MIEMKTKPNETKMPIKVVISTAPLLKYVEIHPKNHNGPHPSRLKKRPAEKAGDNLFFQYPKGIGSFVGPEI